MAKIRINRIFEVSKYLQTKSGQELRGVLEYVSDFAETTIRNLKNGLTFVDNIDCEIRRVTVREDTEVIIAQSSVKRPVKIFWDRVLNSTYYSVTSFGWKFDDSGQVVVKFKFDGTPASNLDLPVDLTIIYG